MRIKKTAPEGLSQSGIVSILVFWRVLLSFGTVIKLRYHWDHVSHFRADQTVQHISFMSQDPLSIQIYPEIILSELFMGEGSV